MLFVCLWEKVDSDIIIVEFRIFSSCLKTKLLLKDICDDESSELFIAFDELITNVN